MKKKTKWTTPMNQGGEKANSEETTTTKKSRINRDNFRDSRNMWKCHSNSERVRIRRKKFEQSGAFSHFLAFNICAENIEFVVLADRWNEKNNIKRKREKKKNKNEGVRNERTIVPIY